LPFPDAPDAMVSHGVLLDAVHAQPDPPLTAILPVPPADPIEAVSGAIVNAQPGACVIVTRWPATVAVPLRAGPLVAATDIDTAPLPFPDAPLRMVTHGTSDAAVQAHPLLDPTATDTGPPAAPTEWASGSTW
jgi:hypothetical protein